AVFNLSVHQLCGLKLLHLACYLSSWTYNIPAGPGFKRKRRNEILPKVFLVAINSVNTGRISTQEHILGFSARKAGGHGYHFVIIFPGNTLLTVNSRDHLPFYDVSLGRKHFQRVLPRCLLSHRKVLVARPGRTCKCRKASTTGS